MKFGKRMADEMVPAWREHYVSYKRLKQHVRQSQLKGAAFADELFRCIREELTKAETHFQVLIDELAVNHDNLMARKHTPLDPTQRDREASFVPLNNKSIAGEMLQSVETNDDASAESAEATQAKSKRSGGKRATVVVPVGAAVAAASAEAATAVPLQRNPSGVSAAGKRKQSLRDQRRQSLAPPDNDEEEGSTPVRTGYPGMMELEDDYTTPTQQPGARSAWDIAKRLFLFSIGDKSREQSKRQGQVGKGDFIEWFTEARRLIRYAELNLEALNKTLKKLKKWRAEEGDFSNSIEVEISQSLMTTSLPRLHSMMDDVKETFHAKFENERLEQYENVTMATTEVWHAKWGYVGISVFLFFAVLMMPVFDVHPPAHRCLALFVLVISMWVTEAIPFFCTAMLIPLIAVPLGVLQDPATGAVAEPVAAARVILSRIFDHVQILVLGGLTMAKAMSKTHIEVSLTAYLHSLTAHRPNLYLLGVMTMGCVLCAFVSNVAAPLLVLSVIQQTLWEFPVEAPEAPRAILLGLAFSCNLGGMLSPIASPQNAVAMQTVVLHHFSFASWICVAVPIVGICLLAAWAGLIYLFQPFQNVAFIPHQVVTSVRKPMKKEIYLVSVVCLITVTLWCLPPRLIFGDTGIIALIPIVVFFGVGVLKKDDFNSLPWHLMFLLAGGNMLGQCARDSKLLEIVSGHLRRYLLLCTPYQVLTLIAVGVGFLTTFVSHTVAAMILMPVISSIGTYFPPFVPVEGQYLSWAITPEALVFCAVFMCSGAMAFPISSFPNVNSLLAEDEVGVPYLKARDFLVPGTIMTLLCLVLLIVILPPIVNLVIQYSGVFTAVAHTFK